MLFYLFLKIFLCLFFFNLIILLSEKKNLQIINSPIECIPSSYPRFLIELNLKHEIKHIRIIFFSILIRLVYFFFHIIIFAFIFFYSFIFVCAFCTFANSLKPTLQFRFWFFLSGLFCLVHARERKKMEWVLVLVVVVVVLLLHQNRMDIEINKKNCWMKNKKKVYDQSRGRVN